MTPMVRGYGLYVDGYLVDFSLHFSNEWRKMSMNEYKFVDEITISLCDAEDIFGVSP